MYCLLIFLLTLLTQYVYAHSNECLDNVLRYFINDRDEIGVMIFVEERSGKRQINRNASDNMAGKFSAKLNTTYYTFSPFLAPIRDINVKKSSDLNAIFLYNIDNNIDVNLNFLKILQNYRIVGPITNLVFIFNGMDKLQVHKIFQSTWKNFRSVFTYVVLEDDSIYFNYPPFFKEDVLNLAMIPCKNVTDMLDRRIANFSGLSLNVAYVSRPPFIVESSGTPSGPEPNVIIAIAQHLGLSLTFLPIREDMLTVYDNESYHGVWKMLISHDIDILLMSSSLLAGRFQASSPLSFFDFDTQCYFAPKTLTNSNWRGLYGAFEKEVWLGVSLTFFTFIFIFFFTSDKANIPDIVESTVRLHLETSASDAIFNNLTRSFLALFLIYISVFTNLYKSYVITLHTFPEQPKAVKSLEEAYDAGLIFYLPPKELIVVVTNTQPSLWQKATSPGRYEISLNRTYKAYKAAVEKRGIFNDGLITGKYLLNAAYGDFGGESLVSPIILHLTSYPMVSFMAPGHPLLPQFNEKILQLLSGGFIQFWLSQVLNSVHFKQPSENGPKPIRIKEISIVFHLYLFMLTFAIVTFVLENIFYYSETYLKKKPLNLLKTNSFQIKNTQLKMFCERNKT